MAIRRHDYALVTKGGYHSDCRHYIIGQIISDWNIKCQHLIRWYNQTMIVVLCVTAK